MPPPRSCLSRNLEHNYSFHNFVQQTKGMKTAAILFFTLLSGILYGQFSEPQVVSSVYELTGVESKLAFIMDVDLDGQPDVVQPNGNWFKRDLAGNFQAPRTFTPAPSGDVFAVADLDGNGTDDLVVQDEYDMYWHSSEGNGSLEEAQLIGTLASTNYSLTFCLTGDLNNDGSLDVLVVAHNFGQPFQMIWWPQLADGSFGDGIEIRQWPHQLTSSIQVELEDGDGDGDLDIFLDLTTEGWLVNDGTGSFDVTAPVGTEQPNAARFTTGDLDGDGDQDVLVTNLQTGVTWYENLGGMSFGPAVTLVALPEADIADVGDWDNDGDPDVLVSVSGSFTLLLREADGTYSSTTFEPLAFPYPYFIRHRMQDLDADGTLDIYMMGDVVGYWIRSPQTETSGTAHVVDLTTGSPREATFGDMDGDGDVDMVKNWGSFFMLHLNEGSVHMPATRPLYEWRNSTRPFAVRLVDVNGDGHLDIIGHDTNGNDQLEWAMNDGTGDLSESYSIGNTPYGPLHDVADMNGDGYPDILVRSTILLNNGESTDWDAVSISQNGGIQSVAVGDLDEDGDNDMVVKTSNGFYRAENDGAGNFTETFVIANTQSFQKVGLMDLNSDGILDITAFDPSVGWYLYHGQTDGTYTFFSQGGQDGTMVRKDFDSDGDLDWATDLRTFDPPTCRITYRGPSGEEPGGIRNKPIGTLAGVDLDNDGDIDLVFSSSLNTYVMENLHNSPYRIEGTLFVDADEDGIRGQGEEALPLHGLVAEPGPVTTISTTDGTYTLCADVGTFSVGPVQNGLWTISPGSTDITVDLTLADAVAEGVEIGVIPLLDSTLFNVVVSTTEAPCGSMATRTLNVRNLGTTKPSGEFCYTLDEMNQFDSSTPPPDSQNGNTYCWDLTEMGYNGSFVVHMVLTLPSVDFMNTITTDSAHVRELDVNGIVLQDQRWEWNELITCSYDPNAKAVYPAGNGPQGVIDVSHRFLDYTIHFQNTGTAPAQTVVLHDVLQPTLKGGELQVLAFSHAPSLVQVASDNDLIVRFDGIMLPDSSSDPQGSQGFFSFRIPLVDEAGHITVVDNTASILFDNNEPVITNTTITTLVDCGLWQPMINEIGAGDALLASSGLSYQWSFNNATLVGDTARVLFPTQHGTYSVQVTNVHGCVSTAEYFYASVGLVEMSAIRFGAFPNPASGELHVVSSAPFTAEHSIEVLDVQGKVIQSIRGNGGTDQVLPLVSTSSGLHLLRISHDQQQVGLIKVVVD